MVKHESEYDIDDARDFNPELRGNLETQIANVADELAFTTHDLDDGLRSGMITPQMLEGIALWEILCDTYNWHGHHLDDMERHRMIRQLVGIMVTDMLEATDQRLKESKAKSALDIQKLKYNVIGYSEEMQRRNRPCLAAPGVTILDNERILSWLATGASLLAQRHLPSEAPPAFLLDSRRRTQVTASPGRFDNRWVVFPQDFPSANFLRAQGIGRAVLVQEDPLRQPQEDLAHVLRRWQEAGLPLFVATLDSIAAPTPLSVQRPSRFRSLWYVALAAMELRRNSAGGFGSIIPQPSSG